MFTALRFYSAKIFFSQRRIAIAYVIVFIIATTGTPGVARSSDSRSVQDLAYGSALYELFQTNYFSALTELMVAEQGEDIDHHKNSARLLRGGLYLSYGMDVAAAELFETVLSSQPDSENASRARFYLGKLLYKKGRYRDAVMQFNQVGAALTKALHAEFYFLRDSAALRSAGEYPEIVVDQQPYTPRIEPGSSWEFYRRYNELVNSLNESTFDSGTSLKTSDRQVDSLPAVELNTAITQLMQLASDISASTANADVEELLALRDKVYVTAGFLGLNSGDLSSARQSFQRVRREGEISAQALFGLGWTELRAGDFQAALAPWQRLQKHSPLQPTTQEALLALPHVYEQLGGQSQALKAYEMAIEILLQERTALTALREQIGVQVFDSWQSMSEGEAVLWLDQQLTFAALPKGDSSIDTQLQRFDELLSGNEMVVLLNQRRELSWLRENLQRWQSDVDTMRFAVEARQQRSAQALNDDSQRQLLVRKQRLQKQRDVLQARSLSAKRAENWLHLATDQEAALWRRIERAKRAAEKLSGEKIINAEQHAFKQQQLDWMAGQLQWQISQASVARNWQHTKLLAAIDRQLLDADMSQADLAIVVEDARQQEYSKQKISLQQQRIADNLEQVFELQVSLDNQLIVHLQEEIDRQQVQLKYYLGQLRLARAKLLDSLSIHSGGLERQGQYTSGGLSQ